MDPGLFSSVSAMRTAERQMEAITSNLANVGTTAYKRRTVAVGGFGDTLAKQTYPQARPVGRTDHTQGILEETSNPYHLAMQGPGFFAVDTPWGQGFTRNGRFQLNEEGELVTQEGFPVAWRDSRGSIDPRRELPSIDPSGTVWQGDKRVGQLRVTDFEQPEALTSGRFAYYFADARNREVEPAGSVVQGSLERSNTNALDELVALVSVQRRFEAAGRMMSMIEQSYSRLANSN